ncbi:hypothetical protein B0T13DRAFT_489293 [Neurospora crassa]|nr:hypothetical protein B0T13DRAFT_489293 [Neurospora crassa]
MSRSRIRVNSPRKCCFGTDKDVKAEQAAMDGDAGFCIVRRRNAMESEPPNEDTDLGEMVREKLPYSYAGMDRKLCHPLPQES